MSVTGGRCGCTGQPVRLHIMTRFHPVERRFEAFLRKPVSLRKAMGVIVTATIVSVAIGGVVINLVDAVIRAPADP